MSERGAAFRARLDAVRDRLESLVVVTPPPGALTDADAATGERWDRGQAWAHLAEFVPYWMLQADTVIAGRSDEAVPFGRVKTDPERVAAIARDRNAGVDVLWERCSRELTALDDWLALLPDEAWERRGLHQTLGEMDLARIVEEFLVGHLEEHAQQLESLSAG